MSMQGRLWKGKQYHLLLSVIVAVLDLSAPLEMFPK